MRARPRTRGSTVCCTSSPDADRGVATDRCRGHGREARELAHSVCGCFASAEDARGIYHRGHNANAHFRWHEVRPFLLVVRPPRGESAKKLRPPLKFTAFIAH